MLLSRLFFLILIILTSSGVCAQTQLGATDPTELFSTTNEDVSVSDTGSLYTIKEIQIRGNKQTKEAIILRELPFFVNDKYALKDLAEKFRVAKKQLMNSGLFRTVVVSLNGINGTDAMVKISVEERWYIYPKPYVKLVDRSVNEWAGNQGKDMSRVNYGLKITHKNFRGRNDRLDINFMNGYTKQFSLNYNNIFLDKAYKWSTSFGVSLGKQREIVYGTVNDKQVFLKRNNDYVHSYFRSDVSVTYRKAIKTHHTFGIGYSRQSFADSLFALNPKFSYQQQLNYPEFYYQMLYQNVDFIPYPTKGTVAQFFISKKGLNNDVNLWQLTAKTHQSFTVAPKYFYTSHFAGMLKLPFNQPYVLRQFMGHGNFLMQGYEKFVIDGVAGGFTKQTFTRELLNTAINIPSQKIKRLNYIPIKVYAKAYGNAGYVHNPDPGKNRLSNRMLYSAGVGLDVVLFYDLIFKFEWSFNHLKQNGLYLHGKAYL